MSALQHPVFPLALSLFVGGSCSAVVDSSRVQCSADADCQSRGAEFENTMCVASYCQALDSWSCADHSEPVERSKDRISIDFTLFDAVNSKGAAGVTASLCGKLDLECAAPISTIKSDADGNVKFDVAPLFDGYVQLLADGYDPTLVFLPPATESTSLGEFPFTAVAAADILSAQLGKPLSPDSGRVLTTITGCDKQTVAGISLVGENMGSNAEAFYAVDGFPSFTATATDSSGFAGFVNVAPGSITLNANTEEGRRIGQVAMFVRPKYVSVRRIQPWTD